MSDEELLERLQRAKRIVLGNGDLVQQFGGVWYAYPCEAGSIGDGGSILVEVGWNPLTFDTPWEAIRACDEWHRKQEEADADQD